MANEIDDYKRYAIVQYLHVFKVTPQFQDLIQVVIQNENQFYLNVNLLTLSFIVTSDA